MNNEQLMSLRDDTPRMGVKMVYLLGSRVMIPKVFGFAGALFQGEDDGDFLDNDGKWWRTGIVNGERVRREID